ncbi:carboxypeptidase PM20D1 [Chitinophaga skermanii]|uniref:Carboxypeptidase PM20D1 n=1 Tax=Chitinophaga skermanii TaxID=331697 RepID=A0A327QYC7_9BACT|nr:M20/M25/M40 family metallo-hydrolase [Chitinophaga skermanii]RAJ08724.1 carboxypeptidase PM20D1 [Chitinophaga skermanii]
MKKLVLGLLLLLVVLVIVIVVKTFLYPFTPIQKTTAQEEQIPISAISIQRFAGGIKIPTVSTVDSAAFNYAPFDSFRIYLQDAYPQIFEKLEFYTINTHGLVFHWKGKQSTVKPILFLSHYDVVPPGEYNPADTAAPHLFQPEDKFAGPITEIQDAWDYYPFSGNVKDGRIYGRGTLDMKNMLFAILEATDKLLTANFTPDRDIYFAFGFDEEVGGTEGALKIAEDFKQKNITFDAVYDEGGIISTKGSLSGINASVALIGCAEKGFWSARVRVKGLGGHSSMPPLHSAMGKAAIIMTRLEEHQMKPMVIPIIEQFFKNIGGTMSFTSKMAIANQWILQPVLLNTLSKNHSTNALIRTTTALTQMKGSDASNVLAPVVEFVVNFRILPGNTVADVRQHLADACKGFDVEIEDVRPAREASNVSPINSQGYAVMNRTINKLFPGVVVTPYLTIGGTDAYKYEIVSDHVYRFMPIAINNFEQQTIHNNNEYISIQNFSRMIRYFELMMKEYDTK